MDNELIMKKLNLVIDKLQNLGSTDESKDKTTSDDDHKIGIFHRDFGIEAWDWPQGVGLYGLTKVQKFYKDDRYTEFFDKWFQNNIKKGLPSRNINTTAPYITMCDMLDTLNSPVYEEMCIKHAEWIMNELPKTKEGGFQHVTSGIGDASKVTLNDSEIWVDTLVMAVLFLNKMGQRFKKEEWVSESIRQFLVHIKYLYDKQTGLMFHGWSFNENNNFGGVFWCRGNSWFTLGVLDYIAEFGDSMDIGVKTYLTDTFKAQVNALVKLQSKSGLWHTVLTDNTSYEEVSGSAGITAGILKGIKLGILDSSYEQYAEKAITGILNNIDEDGTVLNVSAGTPIGYDADHYRNIVTMPMAYGQSLTIFALCESLK